MFRAVSQRFSSAVTSMVRSNVQRGCIAATSVRHKHGHEESPEEIDAYYENLFNSSDDGWQIRKAMNDLQGFDMVPEPKIIIAAMKACRRLDDYALAVRYLEAVQWKCGNRLSTIWPYIHQEIKPTLEELGIDTPEALGYDKPELAVQDVYDIH